MYKLVILASQRALELAEGMPALIEGRNSDKPTVIALEEIAEEKVGLKTAELKSRPKEKTKKKSK
jgi:DNA-directed RNA polymerase omega subunit